MGGPLGGQRTVSSQHGAVLGVKEPASQPEPWAGQKLCHPPANNCDLTVWVATRGDLKMRTEAPGRRVPVAPTWPAPGGEQVPSSHPGRVEGAYPATFSKVDSAQNNLIVQGLLRIATLRRRLWQSRVGRDSKELPACWGRS